MAIKNKEFHIYDALADRLNAIPNGFPKTEDDTYLRVLRWIFSPEEAKIASKMKLNAESIKKISRRVKIPKEELEKKLVIMKQKGQIYSSNTKKGKKYGLLPFVIGIFEEQLHRIDKEFAELIQEYFDKTKGETIFSAKPALHKIIPINKTIKTDLRVYPFVQAEDMIKNAKSWAVRDCICRRHQELLGNPCSYPLSVCISFSSEENAFEDNNNSKAITKEEALKKLHEAEEAGLIHSSMNIASGHNYICNCCTCCCGVFKGLSDYEQPNAFLHSDYILQSDEKLCIGCGICINRCQFDALSLVDEKIHVNDQCVGCGVCVTECPEEAIYLVPREKAEVSKPPKNLVFWMIKRAIKRGINIFKVI